MDTMSASLRALTSVLLAATLFATQAVAGLGTTTGRERGRWTSDRYTLMVARVANVGSANSETHPGLREGILEPIAVLAGTFDPSSCKVLPVTFYIGVTGTTIREAPAAGSLILAVIQVPVDPTQTTGFIVSDICTFMPERKSLVPIEGLGDKRVIETLERLRQIRTSPEAKPAEPRPTTLPSSNPAGDGLGSDQPR